jgi:hypothetical protein
VLKRSLLNLENLLRYGPHSAIVLLFRMYSLPWGSLSSRYLALAIYSGSTIPAFRCNVTSYSDIVSGTQAARKHLNHAFSPVYFISKNTRIAG